MKLLRILPILFISYNLIGCAGQKPTICLSSPETNEFRCYDYENSKWLSKSLQQVDGWPCLSPIDFKNTMDACKRHSSGPNVNACIASYSDRSFHCYDDTTEKLNIITYLMTDNYVCTSPDDQKNLLDHCKEIKRK